MNRRRALMMRTKVTETKTVTIREYYEGGRWILISTTYDEWGARIAAASATIDLGIDASEIKSISVSPATYTYRYAYKNISVTATYGISMSGSVATISHPEIKSGTLAGGPSDDHYDDGYNYVTLTVTYTYYK